MILHKFTIRQSYTVIKHISNQRNIINFGVFISYTADHKYFGGTSLCTNDVCRSCYTVIMSVYAILPTIPQNSPSLFRFPASFDSIMIIILFTRKYIFFIHFLYFMHKYMYFPYLFMVVSYITILLSRVSFFCKTMSYFSSRFLFLFLCSSVSTYFNTKTGL